MVTFLVYAQLSRLRELRDENWVLFRIFLFRFVYFVFANFRFWAILWLQFWTRLAYFVQDNDGGVLRWYKVFTKVLLNFNAFARSQISARHITRRIIVIGFEIPWHLSCSLILPRPVSVRAFENALWPSLLQERSWRIDVLPIGVHIGQLGLGSLWALTGI